jgi:hypothetical protein
MFRALRKEMLQQLAVRKAVLFVQIGNPAKVTKK